MIKNKKVNKEILPVGGKNEVLLKNFSSFRVGGKAKYFIEVRKIEDLKRIISWAKKNKIRYVILGGGSNILFTDKGFDGIVIKPVFNKIEVKGDKIYVESGSNLSSVIALAIKNKLVGMEDLSGIPGTIGGAIRGNAGIKTCSIGDKILSAKVYDASKNKLLTLHKKDFKFEYRESVLKKHKNLILISAVLKLKRVKDISSATSRIKELALNRAKTQPQGFSCGCVFMNPKKKLNGKIVSSGELIDKAGLKGRRIGGAEISKIHANFFINNGSATSKDILDLIYLAKREVYKKFKIRLVEEIEVVQ